MHNALRAFSNNLTLSRAIRDKDANTPQKKKLNIFFLESVFPKSFPVFGSRKKEQAKIESFSIFSK